MAEPYQPLVTISFFFVIIFYCRILQWDSKCNLVFLPLIFIFWWIKCQVQYYCKYIYYYTKLRIIMAFTLDHQEQEFFYVFLANKDQLYNMFCNLSLQFLILTNFHLCFCNPMNQHGKWFLFNSYLSITYLSYHVAQHLHRSVTPCRTMYSERIK